MTNVSKVWRLRSLLVVSIALVASNGFSQQIGSVDKDGSVRFVYGGVPGFTVERLLFPRAALSDPRGLVVRHRITVETSDQSSAKWRYDNLAGREWWQTFHKTKWSGYIDGLRKSWPVDAQLHSVLDLELPTNSIKPGEAWTFTVPHLFDVVCTLKEVKTAKGRVVAVVDLTPGKDFKGAKLSTKIHATRFDPIVCLIDIESGIMLQAKGQIQGEEIGTGKPFNMVFDQDFLIRS